MRSFTINDRAGLDFAYDGKEAYDRAIMTAHALARQVEAIAAMGILDLDAKADAVARAEDTVSDLTAARDTIVDAIEQYEGAGSDNRPGSARLSYAGAA